MSKPITRGRRLTRNLKTTVLAKAVLLDTDTAIAMLADTDTAMAMLAPILREWRATPVTETTVLIVVVVLVLH